MKKQKEIKADSGTPESDESISFSVLASGSTGNSVFVSNMHTKILFDAGLSGKEIEKRLGSIGENAQELSAIIISHEHTDHIKGAGVLSRRYNIPVYATRRTHEACAKNVKKLFENKYFEAGCPFFIDNLRINPFSISHDAVDPCGFTIKSPKSKLGIATDLGIATALVKTRLKNCTGIVLEANHDPYLLACGPYPWSLKQRIKSRCGHLSNEEARDLIGEILCKNTSNIVLGHLSEENNRPEKALDIVSQALQNTKTNLINATQELSTPLFQI